MNGKPCERRLYTASMPPFSVESLFCLIWFAQNVDFLRCLAIDTLYCYK